jgi:hypothetical protein
MTKEMHLEGGYYTLQNLGALVEVAIYRQDRPAG